MINPKRRGAALFWTAPSEIAFFYHHQNHIFFFIGLWMTGSLRP
jgi:hypothetical protein